MPSHHRLSRTMESRTSQTQRHHTIQKNNHRPSPQPTPESRKTIKQFNLHMNKEKLLRIRNSTAEFLIFTGQTGEDGIEVKVADETVWLTQKLIGILFDKGRSTITEHLKNIFEAKELNEKAACRDFRQTADDGKEYTVQFNLRQNQEKALATLRTTDTP